MNWNPKAIDVENEVEFGDIQGEDDGKVYKQGILMELIKYIGFDSSKTG